MLGVLDLAFYVYILRLTLLGGMVFCFAIRSGLEFGLLVGD